MLNCSDSDALKIIVNMRGIPLAAISTDMMCDLKTWHIYQ